MSTALSTRGYIRKLFDNPVETGADVVLMLRIEDGALGRKRKHEDGEGEPCRVLLLHRIILMQSDYLQAKISGPWAAEAKDAEGRLLLEEHFENEELAQAALTALRMLYCMEVGWVYSTGRQYGRSC
jgi:hypothetical protein